jgi:hypothetical protein
MPSLLCLDPSQPLFNLILFPPLLFLSSASFHRERDTGRGRKRGFSFAFISSSNGLGFGVGKQEYPGDFYDRRNLFYSRLFNAAFFFNYFFYSSIVLGERCRKTLKPNCSLVGPSKALHGGLSLADLLKNYKKKKPLHQLGYLLFLCE